MAKHKRKSHRRSSKKTTRRARHCPPGTPVQCKIKEGNGTPVLYCGKMRPIELRAGKGGRFAAVGRKGTKKGPRAPKVGSALYPFAS